MKIYPLLISTSFLRTTFLLIFHKADLFRLCYPLLYTFILGSIRIIFTFTLVWYYSEASVIYCTPNSDYNPDDYLHFDSNPGGYLEGQYGESSHQAPPVNYYTKPYLSPSTQTSGIAELDSRPLHAPIAELDSRGIQPSIELDGRAIQHNPLPSTHSSLVTDNNSVASNINELGIGTPNPSIIADPNSNTESTSQITNYSPTHLSLNSWMVNERGSIIPDRFNADDYSNPSLVDTSPLNTNQPNVVDVGYLAPTPEPSDRFDYTERIIFTFTGGITHAFIHASL